VAFAWLKGHGTENDFVLLPDPDGSVHGVIEAAFAAALCNRRTGIGADGILRVIRTDALRAIDSAIPASAAEWFMDYRNADGSPVEMCGNGIRVFAKYLIDEGLAEPGGTSRLRGTLTIGTRAGDRQVRVEPNGDFSVRMGVPQVGETSKVGANGRTWEALDVRTGNPHAVAFVDDLADPGPLTEEPEYDTANYPDGVNVEFVVRHGVEHIAMRVHERGSGETRSCGTGACAAAVAAMLADDNAPTTTGAAVTYRVDVPGGTLYVTWEPEAEASLGELVLHGPAAIVARGELEWLI
jgi:diaminopimelate epimerase